MDGSARLNSHENADAMPAHVAADARPHVVIVGGGFGGLAAAIALRTAPVRVTLIDKRNYHLFQPLLYQVATAGLSPADIASPIRSILHRQRNATVLLGKVTGVDVAGKAVLLGDARVPFDYLVVATGARHAYFGHDEWEAHAPGLKKIDDATDIRRRILVAFERAEASRSESERQALLTFVVIGAGPTGVETAGAVAELARKALSSDFRNIDSRAARVILVEAAPRVLGAFPHQLSGFAKQALQKLGVEVRLGHAVERCDDDGVAIGGERIAARTVIWAAGVEASPAAKWLRSAKDRAGRVLVENDLSLPGQPDIFVIGDTASLGGKDGKPLPGIAPVAKQEGHFVARLIAARVLGKVFNRPFRYRHLGSMATIGRKSAVAEFGKLRLTGFPAWLMWGFVHVYFLIGFRNRVAVMTDWLWAYLTFQRGARLITGHDS